MINPKVEKGHHKSCGCIECSLYLKSLPDEVERLNKIINQQDMMIGRLTRENENFTGLRW
jgi:hypothetical protein